MKEEQILNLLQAQARQFLDNIESKIKISIPISECEVEEPVQNNQQRCQLKLSLQVQEQEKEQQLHSRVTHSCGLNYSKSHS